jgi:para-nitrobenzyl esterase
MKKPMLILFLLMFTVIFSLGIFAGPVQAGNRVNRSGLLMDPIKIEEGYIAGTVFGNPDDPIRIYRGIPYAAPPVGNLRWKPPQPPAKWSGIRESVNYSIHPVQFMPGRYYPVVDPESEDCLYLNVLTPVTHINEKLPVMVWFHGGGLTGASGNDVTWNFHRLPEHGVIVVTVNTRLGSLGLLAHPELTAESSNRVSGNYMFLDMIAALQWVQKNISKFGGDPKKVTIFGESGGGAKVAMLVSSPLTKGLFRAGIIQSGGYIYPKPLSDCEVWGQQYFAKLGVSTLAEARTLEWKKLVEAYTKMPSTPGLQPAIDKWFLIDTPPNVFASGQQNPVPLITQAVLGELPIPNFMPTMINYYTNLVNGNIKKGVKGYAAIFNQVPTNWRAADVKSFHALDLAYTFGVYDDPAADMWVQMSKRTGLNPPVPPALGEEDKTVSEAMMTMFAQFAKTGDPNLKGKGKGPIYWPAWTPSEDKYLNLDKGLQIKSGFSGLQ